MKRASFALVLLLGIAAACLFVSQTLHTDAGILADTARLLAEKADDPAAAANELLHLEEKWNRVSLRMVVLVGRGCTDPIEESLARLRALVPFGEKVDVAQEALALAVRFEGLWRSGALLWENIL